MDQKYRDLVRAYPEWDSSMKILQNIKSDCLKPCAAAFEANMVRTCVFAMMPAQITFDRIRDGIVSANAYFTATGKMDRTLRLVFLDGIKMVPDELFWVEKQLRDFSQWTDEENNSAQWKSGVLAVEQFAANQESMTTSVQALYTSVILESWLFFEALISDLWVTAVDNSKGVISGRVAYASKDHKKPEEAPKVHELESNFHTHPGSFWREAGKVAFQTKKDIHLFFNMAFEDKILEALNQTVNGDIWTLQAFRNCITHSAGKVDVGFRKQAAHSAEYRDLPIKSRLPLDGAIAARLRNAALMTGAALLQKVDEMLLKGD